MKLFRQLSWYFISERKKYSFAIIILIIIAILQLIPPYITEIIVDGVIHHTLSRLNIIFFISLILIIAIIIYILRYIWRILLFGASYKLAIILREKFYQTIIQQSPSFFLCYRTGDIITRITHDVDIVVFAAGEGVLTLIDSLVIGIMVLIIMIVKISLLLTVLSLLPMIVMSIVINYYGTKLHECFKLAQISFSNLNNYVQEILTNIRIIKSFGIENYQKGKFSEIAYKAGQKNLQVAKIDALFDPAIYIAIGISNIIAVAGVSWMEWNSILTIGQMTSFIMYLGLMIWPMLALAWMFNIMERGSAAWLRIDYILSKKSLIIKDHCQIAIPDTAGVLHVNIDKFQYSNSIKPVLYQLRFQLKPGEILGLCGTTGGGKSTLINLIQRHFEVDAGYINYHNISILKFNIHSWRKRLAVVNQNVFLFSDTIAKNIALGKPFSSQQEIEHVAKLACVHEDIMRLPKKYDTEVGERGIMLSGGQKQRISIARALLLNAEILIFDDALSSVDGYTEYNILCNLRKWRKQHTIIINSNRLSALAEANEILVIDSGIIIQRGNHDTLKNNPGWYQEVYKYQKSEKSLN